MEESLKPKRDRSGRTLYLESGRGLALLGGGDVLRSESDSDTGLRGLEAEDEGRELVQFCRAGEDLGLGRVDIPDRVLYLSLRSGLSLSLLVGGGEALWSDGDSDGALRGA